MHRDGVQIGSLFNQINQINQMPLGATAASARSW